MCSFVRGVGCPSPLFCSGERSRRASRRAALAVSALRRTSWCTACGARGDTTRRSRAGLATLARLDSVRREITIFRASFAACFAAVWAQYLTANCSTRRSHGFLRRRQTTESRATAPAARRPLALLRRGPASGTSAVRPPGLWTPRPNAPVFADASGPASRREWSLPRARRFSSIQRERAAF